MKRTTNTIKHLSQMQQMPKIENTEKGDITWFNEIESNENHIKSTDKCNNYYNSQFRNSLLIDTLDNMIKQSKNNTIKIDLAKSTIENIKTFIKQLCNQQKYTIAPCNVSIIVDGKANISTKHYYLLRLLESDLIVYKQKPDVKTEEISKLIEDKITFNNEDICKFFPINK